MSQWGEKRIINGFEFIPLIATSVFVKERPTDLIEKIILIGRENEYANSVLTEVENEFIGKPYRLWIQNL